MTGLAPQPPPIEAVLFDLDGVIVDSEPWWHAVRAEMAAERGLVWTEADDRACMGRNSRDWAVVMRERLDLDQSIADRCLVVEDSLNGVLAGRAAGMTVVLVPNASVPPGEGAAEVADLVMARLADLDPRRLPV